MEQTARKIIADHPQFTFVASKTASWSPRDSQISYTLASAFGLAGLLHELAHALLGHTNYATDIDLLHKEVSAWEKAATLADRYHITLDQNHMQDCLDTYRDWAYKRSICPSCHANGLQTAAQDYHCLNCGQQWHVSGSRFCRPYRRTGHTKKSQDTVPALSRFV